MFSNGGETFIYHHVLPTCEQCYLITPVCFWCSLLRVTAPVRS
uniref:Uncharacterized protein n=1 Tax=Arundo donax TaxID=35708 RepID=A0A0A9FHI1_ARUDO